MKFVLLFPPPLHLEDKILHLPHLAKSIPELTSVVGMHTLDKVSWVSCVGFILLCVVFFSLF